MPLRNRELPPPTQMERSREWRQRARLRSSCVGVHVEIVKRDDVIPVFIGRMLLDVADAKAVSATSNVL